MPYSPEGDWYEETAGYIRPGLNPDTRDRIAEYLLGRAYDYSGANYSTTTKAIAMAIGAEHSTTAKALNAWPDYFARSRRGRHTYWRMGPTLAHEARLDQESVRASSR